MKLDIKAGTTSKRLQIFIQDSSSTTGAGLTGLTNASAGLVAYYFRDGDLTPTAITLAAGTVGTYSSGGFKEISSANMPGWYEFGPPDAALTGATSVAIHLKGATNMAPLPIEIQLVSYDPNDTVRLGLTALPNVASGSAGAIPTTGTGANQISVSSGQVILQAGTGTGQLDFTSGVVKANATQWLGGTIPAVNVTGVPLVDLKYTLGTISPATAGSVRADAVTGAVGSVTGAVGSVTGAVGSVTGNVGGNVVGSVASVTARVTANTDQIGGVAASATNIARSTQAIVLGTVGAASTTTSIVTSSLDPAAAVTDQFKGRIVIFDRSTTTANLRGQATDITGSTSLGVLTVTALTNAPASGDTFTIT